MPVAAPSEKRPLIPAGDHIFCLVSVEERSFPSYNDPEKMEPRWIWQFVSKATDPETGERFEFRQYTGPRYGDSRATLTILLDQMLPEWTDTQKSEIDTDNILQTYYKARIRHEKAEKIGADPKPKLAFIEPYRNVKASAPAPVAAQASNKPSVKNVAPVKAEEVEGDPYAQEDDEEGFDPFSKEG